MFFAHLLGFFGISESGHRRTGDFDSQIIWGDTQLNSIVLHGNNGSAYTSAGDHAIAVLQRRQHLLPFLLPLLLRKDQHHIEDRENRDERENSENRARRLGEQTAYWVKLDQFSSLRGFAIG